MEEYYRITAYLASEDLSYIVDSKGMFEQSYKFSSFLVCRGSNIIESSNSKKFLEVTNPDPIETDSEHIFLRAIAKGRPEYLDYNLNGRTYKAIKVDDFIYIPDKWAR